MGLSNRNNDRDDDKINSPMVPFKTEKSNSKKYD
jgi:hypothetical protein